MKHVTGFDDFLKDVVNLNSTRLSQLDTSFEAVKKFIKNSTYAPKVSSYHRHGSWAHKTIIRPVDGRAFDADVIMFVQPVDGWEARDYLNELARVFEGSTTYKDKIRRFSHCVTIEYAGERKMDIAPCVIGRLAEQSAEVCNRTSNTFEASNPEGYTAWIRRKNSESGLNHFKKVTRLLKYVRDTKETFTCPSFLFTTLLGNRIQADDKDSDASKDLPSALKTLLGRLDDWLQATPYVTRVANPVLPAEDQASIWDDTKYQNFRTQMRRYREWVDDAFAEADDAESLKKWRLIFGDDFGKAKVVKVAASATATTNALAGTDDVDTVRERGLSALPQNIKAPHWRHTPFWTVATMQMKLTVRATLASHDRGRLLKNVANGDALQAGHYLRFQSSLVGGADLSAYETRWRVTNTGPVAERRRTLRGGFESSSPDHTRWEPLSFRGVHMVEAFLIRKSDGQQVGSSPPFYVVIE